MNQPGTSYLLTNWLPLYQGIDYASGVASYAFDASPHASPPATRIQQVNVLRIRLSAPGISFFTNPQEGTLHTRRRTIADFLMTYPKVRVAINASLAHHDANGLYPLDCTLFGLTISEGQIVCDPVEPPPIPSGQSKCKDVPGTFNCTDVPDETYVGAAALLVTKDNKVYIQEVTAANPMLPLDVWTAVAGSHNPGHTGVNGDWPPIEPKDGGAAKDRGPFLIRNGRIMESPTHEAHPPVAGRTAVGVSKDGQFLYLLTIDGRENNSPAYGASFYDVARWLQIVSGETIKDAFGLDGGGSTAMAKSDLVNGKPVVTLINVPYGDEKTPGNQRAVANYLGVCADALPS